MSSLLFYSLFFHSLFFYSLLFYSLLFSSLLFCSFLFYPFLFYSFLCDVACTSEASQLNSFDNKYAFTEECSPAVLWSPDHTISPLGITPQLLKAQIAGSTTDSSMADSSSDSADNDCYFRVRRPGHVNAGTRCGKARRWLWCLNCHARPTNCHARPIKLCVCWDCSVKRRHCPVCRSENIIIGPLNIEIQRRITRIAIGVKPVETPINGVLKALEVPEWMPFSVRVYSLSELYMTHFRLYCQVSPSKWLRLERVEDFKGVTGGVHFKVLREPDCGLGSRIESDTFGDRIIHTIICDVKNVDFRIQDLLQFRQDQGRVAYDLLRNNCQHFVFEALQHIGAPPTESFPRWARTLQEKWRRYVRRYAQEDTRRAEADG